MRNFEVLVEVNGMRFLTSVHCENIGNAGVEAERLARRAWPYHDVQAIIIQEVTSFWKGEQVAIGSFHHLHPVT